MGLQVRRGPEEFRCNLCCVVTTDGKGLELHKLGAKHRNNLEKNRNANLEKNRNNNLEKVRNANLEENRNNYNLEKKRNNHLEKNKNIPGKSNGAEGDTAAVTVTQGRAKN